MQIRPAALGDYEAFASLFGELGIDDPVPPREAFADDLQRRMIVALEGAEVVGYASFERLKDVGYVRNIVTAPSRRGRGIGRALMEHLRSSFVEAGAQSWCLNVKPENGPAVALYRRCGLEIVYDAYALRVARNFPLRTGGTELEVSAIRPEHEAEHEARFGLAAGELASARGKTSRELLLFSQGADPVGLAVFKPRFGAFPFRVREPRLGPVMLEQVRRRCAPDLDFVVVVAEDDEGLRDALLAHGARITMSYVHMRGLLADQMPKNTSHQ